MPTPGYAAAEIYSQRIREILSTYNDSELENIVKTFQSKPLWKRILYSMFSKDYIDYGNAKNLLDERKESNKPK